MMDLTSNAKSQYEMSRSVHDLNSLNTLRDGARENDPKALEEAAKQFEAIFVKMLLKSMRQAQEAIADKDSPFNSEQVKFFRDMHDQQLATDLSTNGSIGLANLIIQQMSPGDNYKPASIIRSDGDLSVLNRHAVQTREASEQMIIDNLDNKPNKKAAFASPEEFVQTLYPKAIEVAKQLNIDPKALLAQAAVETGWGKYVIHDSKGESSFNLFGIKADSRWNGDKAVVDTLEYVNNLPEKQRAAFRSYQDFSSSLSDYAEFIKANPRYEQALQKTTSAQQYFDELQQAGYATDPAYSKKVMSVYNGDLLNGLLP